MHSQKKGHVRTQHKVACLQDKEQGLRGNQTCPHLGLQRVSGTVRRQMSLVLVSQLGLFHYGSPSKLKPHLLQNSLLWCYDKDEFLQRFQVLTGSGWLGLQNQAQLTQHREQVLLEGSSGQDVLQSQEIIPLGTCSWIFLPLKMIFVIVSFNLFTPYPLLSPLCHSSLLTAPPTRPHPFALQQALTSISSFAE